MPVSVPPVTGELAQVVERLVASGQIGGHLDAARSEIDTLLWRRDVRAAAAEYTAGSLQRGSRDSAAIEGADIAVVEESPMGRLLAAAQAVTAEAPAQVTVWSRAPLQALARLHTVAAYGQVDQAALGRPRVDGEQPDDPLLLGLTAPSAAEAAGRMALLADLVAESEHVPALAIAGIAHAELLTARPFAWGSGLLGRAVIRLVLAARGVDPSLFSVPETGVMQTGRPAYVRALRNYADGDMGAYFGWFATAVGLGAQAAAPAAESAT